MNIHIHRGPTPRKTIAPEDAAEKSRGRQSPGRPFSPCLGCAHTKIQQRRIDKLEAENLKLKRQIRDLKVQRVEASGINYPDKIYVMGTFGDDLVKIGISHDVEKRRLSLAKPTSRSDQEIPNLRIFFQQEIGFSARRFEKHCHNHLRNLRESGEWFRISPDSAVETVKRLLADWKETE